MRCVGRLGLALLLAACAPLGTSPQAPPPRVDGPPDERPPTGTRWTDQEVVDSCGRVQRVRVLVDELCGPSPELELLRVPMFRDGVLDGDRLFTVDASHLWTIDISDPAAPLRTELASGLGLPLALARRGDDLLIAGGPAGLIVASSSTALEVKHRLRLPGPALDVAVHGDRALIAAGEAGLLAVSSTGAPAIEGAVDVGFAVAVTATASTAFVAACGETAIVDLASMAVIGRARIDRMLPMKDVAVEGDRLFVAAGSAGALEFDISDPTAPRFLGACRADEPSFYASGVKVTADRLLVAGGEWGILDVDRGDGSCPPLGRLPQDGDPEEDCSLNPPWTIVVVEEPDPPAIPVPARGRDPVQVLYERGLVLGFGDARRIAVRAVDLHDAAKHIHDGSKIGRYQQPSMVTRLAVRNDRMVLIGERTGLYQVTPSGLRFLQPFDGSLVDVAFLEDGRFVLLFPSQLVIEGEPAMTLDLEAAGRIAVEGARIAVPSREGLLLIDTAEQSMRFLDAPEPAAFAPAIALSPQRAVMASPEWARSFDLLQWTQLRPHRAFEPEEVLDPKRWSDGPPRRLLAASDRGVFEAASFDGRSVAALHGEAGAFAAAALGPSSLTAAAALGDRVYVTAGDSGTYRSELIEISIADGELEVLGSISFTGVAADVAIDAARIYVADPDAGIRVFEAGSDGLTQAAIWRPVP